MPSQFAKRNKQNLSHGFKLSCYMGALVPVLCKEVLPGDIFRVQSQLLVRLAPMVAPVMHMVDVFTHFFFVPNRLVMDDWESFITGGEDGEDATVHPYITIPGGGYALNSLADYFGVPNGVGDTEQINALPFRAYALIFNEWYRDQNLQTELTISKAAGSDTTTSIALQYRNWQKDYFTKCLPDTQKGPEVELSLSADSAPVDSDGTVPHITGTGFTNQDLYGHVDRLGPETGSGSSGDVVWGDNTGLEANLQNVGMASINTLRQGFGLQRLFERLMRGGGRYTEFLQNVFGVRSPDARLQRPEFLGGGKSPIMISEVLKTSSTDGTSPQGEMAGHGFSAQQTHSFKHSFTEHGFVIAIMSIMPKTGYYQGLEKMMFRSSRFDYAIPDLAHLGEQAVYNKEVYLDHTTPDGIFGYLPQYEEYRRSYNRVAGDFRDSLDFWHMDRKFTSDPALNEAFVKAQPTTRIFANESDAPCWVNIWHDIRALRPLPKYGEPGLIDH